MIILSFKKCGNCKICKIATDQYALSISSAFTEMNGSIAKDFHEFFMEWKLKSWASNQF